MSVEELEILRKKVANRNIIGLVLSLILGIVLYVIIKLFPVAIIGFVIGVFITYIINHKATKLFNLSFKKIFVLKALNNVFTDLVYEPEKGIDRSIISDTKMMNMGDRYSSNDYVSGKYKNISVEQADVHIEEKDESTGSNGRRTTHWQTLFRGRWMIFDFNKSFKANIQVCQKGFGNAQVSNFLSNVKYQKISMEDQEFNNNFKIYAQNEHDAFYILTPALMEKIKLLTNKINGKLLFCFIDNKLHIGNQNGRDSFEHSLYKKIDEEKIVDFIAKDIELITSFVDELDLDNDLFRREV